MSEIEFIMKNKVILFLTVISGITLLLLVLLLITYFQGKADLKEIKSQVEEINTIKQEQQDLSASLAMLYNITNTVTEDIGIVAYWSFDKETVEANTAKNLYGQGDAVMKNATYAAEGKINGGIMFNGENGYLQLPGRSIDFNLTKGAIGFWLYPELEKAEQSFSGLIHYRKGNCCSDYFIVRLYKTQKGDYLSIIAEKNDISTLDIKMKAPTIKEEEWNYIIIQQSGNGIEIFVDGTKQDLIGTNSDEWIGLHYPATFDFTIGDTGTWTDNNIPAYLQGRIDELKMWSRSLTMPEIKKLMTLN